MFHKIIQNRLHLSPEDKAYRRAFLILSIISVVVFVLSFYIIYNLLVTKFFVLIGLEVLSLLLTFVSWYVLTKKKNIDLASTILLLTIFTLTLLFMFDQKHNDYALAQAVMFPVITIYLKGLRTGTLFSLIYIVAVLSIAFTGINSWDPVPFTATSFTNLTFTYVVVILVIYYYELSRAEAFNIIQKSHDELNDYKNNLEKKVEEALAEKYQQEEILIQQSKMAVMGDMMAGITHQWKQPLTVISSIIHNEQLEHELSEKKDKATEEAYKKILTQVEYMSQTTSDFSSFFKPRDQKEFFSLTHSFESIQKILQPQLDKNMIQIINNIPDESFMIEGYKNEFVQILLNIITNSKDAIETQVKKGKLAYAEGRIKIDLNFESNKILLFICDNGGGISEKDLVHIFDPYFTTKGQEMGTGIGLYLSKMIIETHMQGNIYAYNSEEGACLQLELRGIKKQA